MGSHLPPYLPWPRLGRYREEKKGGSLTTGQGSHEIRIHRLKRIQTHFMLIITHKQDVISHNTHFVNQQVSRVCLTQQIHISKSFYSVQLPVCLCEDYEHKTSSMS